MALKSKTFRPEDIDLTEIKLVKYTFEQEEPEVDAEKSKEIELQIGTKEAFSPKNNLAKLQLDFIIRSMHQNHIFNTEIGLEYYFHIKDSKKYITEQENGIVVDKALAANLMSLAYATSRGIVWQLINQTFPGQGIILPVVDAFKLLAGSKGSKTSKKRKKN